MLDERVASALTYTERGLRDYGYVGDDDLHVRLVADAVATARRYGPGARLEGALHDRAGRLIASTQRHNAGDLVPDDPPRLDTERMLAAHRCDSALYGGILFPILGHFLVESLSRLWPLLWMRPHPAPPVYFHHWPDLDLGRIFANPLYVAILAALGLGPERVRLIEHDCSFRTLLLPDPASRYHLDMHARMADLADYVAGAIAAPAVGASEPLLYLSRSRWTDNRRIRNETAIDAWAHSRGLRVVHPECEPPDRLLRCLLDAQTIVASDGSHAHLLLFCRPGTRVVMLDTRPVPTQFALARLRGFPTVHLPLFERLGYEPETGMADIDALAPLIETALGSLYR